MSSQKRKTRMTVVNVPTDVSDKMRKPSARRRSSRNFLESLKNYKSLKKKVRKFWATVIARARSVTISRPPRRLRVCESVSLGEKRLVAVVQFEQQRFLLGASASAIGLLSILPPEASFGAAFRNCAVLQAKLDEVMQDEVMQDDAMQEELKVAL